jgi:hypothetical protein
VNVANSLTYTLDGWQGAVNFPLTDDLELVVPVLVSRSVDLLKGDRSLLVA